jgi:tetratricopeptide (TPR) repeat protein
LKHKALLQGKQFDEAIRTLKSIPKSEHTPKTRAALAKLLTTRLPSKPSKSNRDLTEITACHNFVLSHYPSTALHSYNELITLGVQPANNENAELPDAAITLFKGRELSNALKPMQAIQVLNSYRKPNEKIILELAYLYNLIGNRALAIRELERLRLINPNGTEGLDLLAGLYAAESSSSQLELLVNELNEHAPNSTATLLAMAYFCVKTNNLQKAHLFAQRAISIAPPGKARSSAALLRALLLTKEQRYQEADQYLQNILTYDSKNIDVYELSLRSLLARVGSYNKMFKRFTENLRHGQKHR